MILPGHIASAWLIARPLKLHRPTVLAAALFPDAVDKSLHWVARLTASDRLWAHTAWLFGGTTLLALLAERLSGRRGLARAWGWGYAIHLLGDVTARFAFFYPLSRHGYHEGARMKEVWRGQRRWPWRIIIAEGLLVGAAIVSEVYAKRNAK